MNFPDWERVIIQLEKYREKTGISPLVTVWGGEPLVSVMFDDIMTLLKDKSFKTEAITNGVMIDKHFEVLKKCADTLYVSLDGTREIHDAVRGKGVYDKVIENIKKLEHKNITVMSVITDRLIEVLPQLLSELNTLNINKLFLQDMIGLTAEEVKAYKDWLKRDFGIDDSYIDSWETEDKINFSNEIEKTLAKCDLSKLDFSVVHKKHIADKETICLSPFTHPHIAWNGNVHYCTDFYGFSAGNIRSDSLENIFYNDKSERFRRAVLNSACPSCNHCSWRSYERI